MKYKINGRKATQAEAHDAIREAVPNGGVDFLKNTVRNCQREGLETMTLHVGTRMTIEVNFR